MRRVSAAAEVPPWLEAAGRWAWNLLPIGLGSYLLLEFLWAVHFVVLPILIALLAAALLRPPTRRLAAHVPEGFAAALVVGAAVALIVAAVIGTGALIARELVDADQWTQTRLEIRHWLRTGPANLTASEVEDLERRTERWLTTGPGEVSTHRAFLLGQYLGGSILTLLLLFFFVKDGSRLWSWVVERLRPERRPVIHRAGTAAFGALEGYIRGVALTGLVDAVLIGAGLFLLGVPLALPLALLTFAGAFFPIVGAAAMGGLAAVVALVSNGPSTAIAVIALTLVVQQVEGNLLMPIILRRRLRLHPAVILTALAVGGGLGGIAGAFVAVPMAGMASAVLASVRHEDREDDREEPATDSEIELRPIEITENPAGAGSPTGLS